MATTWKRLFGPAQLTNTTATKYTVPALTKTKITHIVFNNPSSSTVTITFGIGADAAGTRIRDAFPIAPQTCFDYYGTIIMDAAEVLPAHAGTTSVIVMTVFGQEITLG